jgi:hypothetical protein
MATALQPGDVVIRHYVGDTLQLIDATTNEQLAIIPSVDYALKIAHQRAGAVWHEKGNRRLGTPELSLVMSRRESVRVGHNAI